MEVVLIMVAITIRVVSFLITDKKESAIEPINGEDIKNLASNIIKEEIQNQLSELSDDVLENTEAKLDKLANQKIMAVGNYSEDVLKNIEDNHNEVMFLYNMLNDKETTLKNTVRDIEAVKVSVKQMSDTVQSSKETRKESGRKNSRGKKSRNTSQQKQNEENIKNQENNRNLKNDKNWENDRNWENDKDTTQIQKSVWEESTQELIFGEGEKSEIVENKEKVLELYRQGRTNVEIAKELNLGVGEVNLVLGLFK